MRTIDPDTVSLLEAKTLRPFFVLDLEIDGTHYRYTDCDVPLMLDSETYSPRGAKLEPIRYSLGTVVDSMKMRIDNLDSALTAAFVDGTPQGSTVILKLVLVSGGLALPLQYAVTLFEGSIDGWNLDEESVSFTVASELVQWSHKTLAKHSASCRWKEFKGTECAYAGAETWCDRSYTRCAALGNQVNFGGFRWLPSIIDKELWWGRVRSI
jgi:hypothetical protein